MKTVQNSSPVVPAKRPFTRALNVIYDQIKPNLYHKVDRSVLDAILRLTEGFQRDSVARTIPELARAAGVSDWSVTQALARLEASNIISRERHKLTKAGRYIWVLTLSQAYRVTTGAPVESMGLSHGMVPCEGPMPMKETKKELDLHHHAPGRLDDVALQFDLEPEEAELLWQARLADAEVTPELPLGLAGQPIEKPIKLPEPQELAMNGQIIRINEDEADPKVELAGIQEPENAPSENAPSAAQDKEIPPGRPNPSLTPEQAQSLTLLRTVGVDYWKARQLARSQPLPLIARAVENLQFRAGSVRNSAAWIVREVERGGYSTTPQQAEAEKREQEKIIKQLQKQREEERLAEETHLEELKTKQLLGLFRAMSPELQAELEEKVRAGLAKVSRRLSQGPWDIESPGPLRSQLLALLESLPSRTNGLTPRSGGWGSYRHVAPLPTQQAQTPRDRDFSRVPQDPSRHCATPLYG